MSNYEFQNQYSMYSMGFHSLQNKNKTKKFQDETQNLNITCCVQ